MSHRKAAALLLLAAAMALPPLAIPPVPASAYLPRPPIFIDGNADFTQAGAGYGCECVLNGTGAPSDPYVIEGWEVDASTAHGISVQNTNAWFVIRDVYVHSGGSAYDGISFLSVSNGTIEDSTFSGNLDGIRAWGRNLTIANNTISANLDEGIFLGSAGGLPNANTVVGNTVSSNAWQGINLNACSYVTVAENIVRNNGGFGILLWYSDHINVTRNNASFNQNAGVTVGHSADVLVSGNSLYRNLNGVTVSYGSRTTVANNTVASSDYSGLAFWTDNDVTVTGNTVAWNPSTGIGLDADVTGARLYHNALFGNGVQALDKTGPGTSWDSGYPGGGNYWSNHGGVDNCSGVLQDICPDPDRIVDTPYSIDADSRDRYPLVAPLEYVPPRPPTLVAARLSGGNLENLTLVWSRSSDEGSLGGTVAYRILRAVDSAFGPFVRIAEVIANGSAGYEYECPNCGHVLGDEALLFFKVQSADVWNNTAESGVAARYTAAVSAGMNLLAVPLRTDSSPSAVLQSLWPAVTVMRAYDSSVPDNPWKSFVVAKGHGTLASLEFGAAFWVNLTSPGQYTVAGLVEGSPAFALRAGWNLVAYASVVAEDVSQSLAGVSVRRVEAFNASSDPYRLRAVPSDEVLVWGEGYWVEVATDGVWFQG